jgi:hypothetical protein
MAAQRSTQKGRLGVKKKWVRTEMNERSEHYARHTSSERNNDEKGRTWEQKTLGPPFSKGPQPVACLPCLMVPSKPVPKNVQSM